MKNEKILANRTFDFCDLETFVNSNVFFHSLLHHMLENMNFALKCPFEKVKGIIFHCLFIQLMIDLQGVYIMKEHRMPNYVVPGLMKLKDKTLNVQKVKSRLDQHIVTVFESSYITEVCSFDNWKCIRRWKYCNKKRGERLSESRWWKHNNFRLIIKLFT